MKITDYFKTKKTVVSFEIFPPKPDSPFEPILNTVDELVKLRPDYISVTYGAAGSNRGRTMDLAEHISKIDNIDALAHLTCIIDTPNEIETILADIKNRGIENILALRGDHPQDSTAIPQKIYAKDLVSFIKKAGDFAIGGAAYPEGHPECPNKKEEFSYLLEKIDSGVDFLISQIFFDNTFLYNLQENLLANGKTLPLCAGIMPVFSAAQVNRICSMCATSIPEKLQKIMDKYADNNDDMQKAGLDYAFGQIDDLLKNDIRGIHLYTMNRPSLAIEMINNTGLKYFLGENKSI